MEDAMNAKHTADLAALKKEWEKKLKEAVDKTRVEEKDIAKKELVVVRNDFDGQIDVL